MERLNLNTYRLNAIAKNPFWFSGNRLSRHVLTLVVQTFFVMIWRPYENWQSPIIVVCCCRVVCTQTIDSAWGEYLFRCLYVRSICRLTSLQACMPVIVRDKRVRSFVTFMAPIGQKMGRETDTCGNNNAKFLLQGWPGDMRAQYRTITIHAYMVRIHRTQKIIVIYIPVSYLFLFKTRSTVNSAVLMAPLAEVKELFHIFCPSIHSVRILGFLFSILCSVLCTFFYRTYTRLSCQRQLCFKNNIVQKQTEREKNRPSYIAGWGKKYNMMPQILQKKTYLTRTCLETRKKTKSPSMHEAYLDLPPPPPTCIGHTQKDVSVS